MVLVQELTHKYPKQLNAALSNLSFTVAEGEIFGMVGPNGAGKTTVLKILSTLLTPTSGTVTVEGKDVRTHPSIVKRAIAFSSGEERSFYYRLTGFQNLEFFGGLYGIPRETLKRKIYHHSEALDIQDQLHLPYRKYNLGTMKKLSIVRALLTDASVFLFDEPNNGIDPLSAVRIREIIKSLAGVGKTVIVTTHNLSEIEKICPTIGILDKGKLVLCDKLDKVKASFQRRLIEIVFSEPLDLKAIRAFAGHLEETSPLRIKDLVDGTMLIEHNNGFSVDHLIRLVARENLKVLSIQDRPISLEEIFIDVTSRS